MPDVLQKKRYFKKLCTMLNIQPAAFNKYLPVKYKAEAVR